MAIAKKYWTRGELIRKIQREGDLEGEDFISPEEMQGYFIEAVSEVEKIVHSLYEDYFLTKTDIEIINGTGEYDLPESIYAHKIRSMYFEDGSESPTEVVRSRDFNKMGRFTSDRFNSTGDGREFNYFLLNSVPGEPKIVFTPTPRRTGTVTVWHLRNANRFEVDSDILDIPESVNFVCQYVRVRCYEKEGSPLLQKGMQDLVILKEQFEGILRDMVPDDNTRVPMDLTFYMEMS